jgi:glycosyltransferase involved in cell wall biosynthesis
MKRILIDGRFIGVGESISRYVLEMLSGVLELDHDNSYTLLIRPEGEKSIERCPNIINAENLKVDILDIPHYSVAEQTKLLSYLKNQKFDLVHFTQFNHPILYKGNFVVTIHDLTLIGHLHYHNFIKQMAFNTVMKSAAKDSKKIIAISKTTMDDVIDYFGTNKKKFDLIYLGLDHLHYNESVKKQVSKIKNFKNKYKIENGYILYTGMWKKHKNLIRLFKAFEQFKLESKSSLKLVLTGKIDKNEPEVISEIDRINKSLYSFSNNQKSIITTGFIDEEELPVAYAGAKMYVIPSLSEGFGWPPLEAMACGTPVIASNLSCIPEILGDAPYYFDPYKIDEIKKAIEKVSSDDRFRTELVEKGLKQVAKYRWENTSKQTLEVYKSLL